MNATPAPRAVAEPPAESPAPVAPGARIDALDFLRGIAVMGILAANIAGFGQPYSASFYPGAFRTDPGDPGGWLWLAQFVAIDGKMRGLFTLLFGAGLVLFMERAWARGGTWRLQAWRLTILLGFGLAHFFFIWQGDILVFYALFGLAALASLGWSARAQLGAGLALYLLGCVYYLAFSLPWLLVDTPFGARAPEDRAELAAFAEQALADDAVPDAAIASGDYAALVHHRLTAQTFEPLEGAAVFSLETLPLMLIGMALYRLGLFGGGMPRAQLIGWGLAGTIAGALAHLAIGLAVRAGGFSYYGTLAAFIAWSPLPRLWMVLGLAALLTAWAPAATGWLGERVRAAGRAAFTNYLGTSVVMMVVFHGWGLGLFGQLNRPQLYLVVVLAWIVMLAWSKPWLDRYRYGPLEWLWRCLTYRTLFALRK